MAASSSSSAQQDHHRTGDDTGHPRDANKHRRHHLDHLQVQVPHNGASFFAGCFRPSPPTTTSSSPAAGAHVSAHGHGHTDRPASPSLIRSPTAWIRGAFGSGKHTRRRSRDLHQYDATSYARNFDEGGTDGEGDEEAGLATSDALKYRLSPSGLGPGVAGVVGRGTEPACETGRDRE